MLQPALELLEGSGNRNRWGLPVAPAVFAAHAAERRFDLFCAQLWVQLPELLAGGGGPEPVAVTHHLEREIPPSSNTCRL